MSKFKVGDRVRHVRDEYGDRPVPVGAVGTVLEECDIPCVEWDDFTEGHDGGGPSVQNASWAVMWPDLALVSKRPSLLRRLFGRKEAA